MTRLQPRVISATAVSEKTIVHDRGEHGVDATATTADIRDCGAHEEDVPRRGAHEVNAIATATDTRDRGVQ